MARARRLIGKKIELESGGEGVVEDVVIASTENDRVLPYVYLPQAEGKRKALAFRVRTAYSRAGTGIQYERVNSRVRYKVIVCREHNE